MYSTNVVDDKINCEIFIFLIPTEKKNLPKIFFSSYTLRSHSTPVWAREKKKKTSCNFSVHLELVNNFFRSFVSIPFFMVVKKQRKWMFSTSSRNTSDHYDVNLFSWQIFHTIEIFIIFLLVSNDSIKMMNDRSRIWKILRLYQGNKLFKECVKNLACEFIGEMFVKLSKNEFKKKFLKTVIFFAIFLRFLKTFFSPKTSKIKR